MEAEPWLQEIIENEKYMTRVIESWWPEKQDCWARGFLSWNRENEQLYGDFAKEVQAKAKEKGIDLIIDRDFDLRLLDDRHDKFSHMIHVSFVLLTLDYVESGKCVRELLYMYELDITPCPIIYYPERKPVVYYMLSEFINLANESNGTEDDVAIETIMTIYFHGERKASYQPPSADLPLSKAIQSVLASHWFPDYDTFRSLDPCAKWVYEFMIMTSQQQVVGSNQNQIMYLGLVGSNDNYNKFIAQNVCSPHRLSDFIVYSFDMNDPRESFNGNQNVRQYEEDWFCWALCNLQRILKMSLNCIFRSIIDRHPLDYIYKSVLDYLPKQKCLLLIENIYYYDQLKAYAKVLDFVNPCSIIFFTTTNESFFAKHNDSWKMESLVCDSLPTLDGLPSLSLFEGQMLQDTEREWLEKLRNGASLRQEQPQSVVKTGTPSVEKHEPPSHEECGGTNDDVEGGAAPLKKLKA